jgi:hypothetical protein
MLLVPWVKADGERGRFQLETSTLACSFRTTSTPSEPGSATLVIGGPKSLPARRELLFQNTILFDQRRDRLGSLTGEPASERQQEEL